MPELSGSSIGFSALCLAIVGFLAAAGLLSLFFWLGWRWTHRGTVQSPYADGGLRRVEELTYASVAHLQTFLADLDSAQHPPFDLTQSVICSRSGRIFFSSLNAFGEPSLSWRFLKRYYRGKLVSWGSLSPREQAAVCARHSDMAGYQCALSSPRARPQDVEREYALMKPGPLYVDPERAVLLGWKCVPCTDLEVLVPRYPDR